MADSKEEAAPAKAKAVPSGKNAAKAAAKAGPKAGAKEGAVAKAKRTRRSRKDKTGKIEKLGKGKGGKGKNALKVIKGAKGAKPKQGEAAPLEKKTSSVAKGDGAKDAVKVKKSRRGGLGKRNRKARLERKEEKTKAAALKRSASAGDGPPAKKRRPHKSIYSGVMKFSRPYKYHRRGAWKFTGKKTKKVTPKKPRTIKKEIGGEKNGGFRIVLLKKRRNNYPTADPIRKRRMRGTFSKHTRYTRKSLKPGTICILLAGIHKGKRVVLLKVLKSGLLLVNGPFKVNGVPLRRVNQNYVIATRTRLDLSGARIPNHLNDLYFKRIRPKKTKKEGEDIFSTKKEKYVPSEQRKTDQKAMDKIVMDGIKAYGKKTKTTLVLIRYLKSMFGLKRNQRPHSMIF